MATIVILDDQATNRAIYARLAQSIEEGIVVEVFSDPLDALEWLEHNPVELVVTDFRMPSMDGAAFTRRLRALPHGAETPVIVVTAHDDRGFRVRALDAGATDFLQSPIDPFELVTRARNLLALGRQRRPNGGRGAAEGSAPAHGKPAEPTPPETLAASMLPRGLLDALPAMISAADRAGRCVFANARLAQVLGAAAPDELIGAGLGRLLGTARAARHRRDDQRVFDTGETPPPYEEEVPGPGGAPRRLLTMKAPVRDAAGSVAAVVTASFELGDPAAAPRPGLAS